MKNVALITGASSGIGRELAKIHAQKGGDLVLVARNKQALDELKTEIVEKWNRTVHVLAVDLTTDDAVTTIGSFLTDNQIELSCLMNNAGFGGFGPFHEQSLAESEAMMELNMRAVVRLAHLVLPGFLEKGKGRILNTASTAAFMPGPMQAIYFATKAFVLSFSEGIAEEVSGTGVTVTALCPGPAATGFAKEANMENSPLFKRAESAASVAAKGYRAMEKGRLKVITNLSQAFMIRFLIPISPDRLVLKVVRKMQ